MSSIAVEEAEILQIVRDFLEEGGYTECLGALEKHPGAGPRGLSELHELRLVRELVLDGRWGQLLSYLQPLDQSGLGEKEDFRRCQYAVAKQRYLESLAKSPKPTPETFSVGEGNEEESSRQRLQRFMAHLQELERLCPSKEEYSALCNLLTAPSLSAHGQYRSWDMHHARMECFHTVATWLIRALYPGMKIELSSACSKSAGLQSNRLTRLLAKGLLYEECETTCSQRCGDSELPTEILDLCGWMQHQPDSAFQVAPSRLALTFVPHTASRTSQLRRSKSPENLGRVLTFSKTAGATTESLKVFPNASSQPRSSVQQSLVSRSVPAIHLVDSIAQTPTGSPKGEGRNGSPTLPSRDCSLQHRQQQSEKPVAVAEERSQPSTSGQEQPVTEQTRTSMKTEKTTVGSVDPVKRQENGGCVEEPLAQSNPETPPKRLASTQAPTSQPHSLAPQVHLATTTSDSRQLHVPKLTVERFEDNFTSMLAPMAEQALRTPSHVSSLVRVSAEGRNSSTPKPLTIRPPPQPSPTTSPVPYVAGTHGLSDTPYRPAASAQSLRLQQRESAGGASKVYTQSVKLCTIPKALSEGGSKNPVRAPAEKRQKERTGLEVLRESEQESARKHIDFAGEDKSVQWPTSVLLSTISDPQVVRSVAFSETGEMVAVGANSKTLRLCSTLPLTEETASDCTDDLPVFYHHPRYHKGSIYCLAWHGDTLLASGSNDQTIRLLRVTHDLSSSSSSPTTNCSPQGQLNIHNGTVRGLAFLRNGHLLSGGAGDTVLKLSDCGAEKVLSTHTGHSDQVLAVTVISDTVVASGSQDKTVKLWDTRHRRSFHTFELPSPVASLSVHDDALATAHLDGSCGIHSLRTLKPLGSVYAHHDECRAVQYSLCGSWLLTGAYDGRLCLVDCESLQWREVGGHQDKVIQCCWHRGGRVFASTGVDRKACFWALR